MKKAVDLLDEMDVDFEYEGEMTADIALNAGMMKNLYPFSRLTGSANILIMPGLHSANISAKLLKELGQGEIIGPIIMGLEKPAQVVPMSASVSDILNVAAIGSLQLMESGTVAELKIPTNNEKRA